LKCFVLAVAGIEWISPQLVVMHRWDIFSLSKSPMSFNTRNLQILFQIRAKEKQKILSYIWHLLLKTTKPNARKSSQDLSKQKDFQKNRLPKGSREK